MTTSFTMSAAPPRPNAYDAIVIGSGAGGSAAAYRLALGGLAVALLEKGDHLPSDGSTLDIGRVVHEGQFLSGEPWLDGRGRTLRPEEHFNVGGKTKWYGAALLRFGDAEFAADAAHAGRGWPITPTELAPYYAEAERLLDVRTFDCEPDLVRIVARLQTARSAWEISAMPLGLAADILEDPREASHFDGFASVRKLKAEADRSLLSRLGGHPNFQLITRAEVTGLLGSEQSPATIRGVRLADGREIFAPRVFLAAGALHSPRLLSRYLTASGLQTVMPAAAHIGRYVKLHLLTALVALSPGPKADLLRKTVVMTHKRFAHSSAQPLGFDGELISTLMPRNLPMRVRRELGARAYGFFLQTEDGSDARNRVLDSSTSQGLPVLDYDESRLPAARREHRAFTWAFQRALGRAGLVSFTRRIGLNGTAHVCGSLICGTSALDSVVDAQGSVHGMRGLYVVDGSVLPRSSRVNPSLTIYAWALRVADLVAREYRHERKLRQTEREELSHAL